MRRQMEVTSAWTGEKKTKIQSTPTSACGDIGEAEEDDASAMIIVQEGPEQLEGLDWDQDTLDEKIDSEPCVFGSECIHHDVKCIIIVMLN